MVTLIIMVNVSRKIPRSKRIIINDDFKWCYGEDAFGRFRMSEGLQETQQRFVDGRWIEERNQLVQ